MNKKLLQNFFKFSLFFPILLLGNIVKAQTFDHIEATSGLNIEKNNGVAVADYDGDNDLDIFVVAVAMDDENDPNSHSRLFRNNNNGTFTDVTEASGLMNLLPYNPNLKEITGLTGLRHGVSWGDYDNDGFPDLFLTNSNSVQLFHNEKNGTFVDVTQSSGIIGNNICRNMGATWFDYNKDGYLDLFINSWKVCNSNTLYLNNRNGTFTNKTAQTGIIPELSLSSFTAVPFDINNDNWMDLYVSNDFKKPNSLFLNQGGNSFVDKASDYKLDSKMDDMGITVGDFNNDGFFDFFITGIDENALLQNDGTNHFTEVSAENNITGTGWAWGTHFADFDLDGDLDLFIANGYKFATRSEEKNVYYKNLKSEGGNGFEDYSAQTNLNENTISVEGIDFDYDNDGDLDLFVTNSSSNSFFYENKVINNASINSKHWLEVKLQGTVSNRDAIGTQLTVKTASGTIKRYYTGVGFFGQSLQAVHFGLNEDTTILELTIQWPSGQVDTYNNLAVDKIFKAIESIGIQPLNIVPSQKIFGCTDPNSCNYDPNATSENGSCSYIQAYTINGSQSSGFFKTETYSCNIPENQTAIWKVTNGEIINGQGTGTITVKWELGTTGTVSITQNNGICSSPTISINVSLSAAKMPKNVSVARLWNEALLEAIRYDFARPTVHARNIFHTSIALYDAWAIYDKDAKPYLVGNNVNGFNSNLEHFTPNEDVETSRKKAISYAAYGLLKHRFANSPGKVKTLSMINLMMDQLGYDTQNKTNTNYQDGDAAALGNYIAQTIINYGKQDGSRETTSYDNEYYQTVNPPLTPNNSNNIPIVDPNRWQPMSLDTFIDQSGNVIPGKVTTCLTPEWGNVYGFSLSNDDKVTYQRDGHNYNVYNDPGTPPYISQTESNSSSDAYKWTFSMVAVWSSHLNPKDGVMWDISPKSKGNINLNQLPTSYLNHPNFYKRQLGGDIGLGREMNPITNMPYVPQIVPRGDYTRVLAEFWADGPHSETPPGHWFTIFNYVSDQMVEHKLQGQGPNLEPLEWEIKSYFILSGAMHDAAISAWSVKGWYDYIRPISAIRYMAEKGQSSNPSLPNYNVAGIPLEPRYIEVVQEGDLLAGTNNENVGKIKLYSWKGPEYITNEQTDEAGVNWILAQNWWPYQRPTFVTPPFQGYVSGHSTYSRAAAEVLTKLTGSEYFPNGMGEFKAPKNEFLVFEQGPSVDVTLQWATYRDASDQCSLSRIWGGIHPPADDIPGRLIGEKVGVQAFNYALPYFYGKTLSNQNFEKNILQVYPNPVTNHEVYISNTDEKENFNLFDIRGRQIDINNIQYNHSNRTTKLIFPDNLSYGIYLLKTKSASKMLIFK